MLNAAISPLLPLSRSAPPAEADFPLMKAIWPKNSRLRNFLLRLRLHRDVLVQILPLCSFRVALCLASALLTQGFLVSVSQCGFQDSYYMFSFFSPGNYMLREEKDLLKHLPRCHQAGMTKAPLEQLQET